eukprot:scaffold401_cov399-Prasinococcus_capsulatus_cf.AAC.40
MALEVALACLRAGVPSSRRAAGRRCTCGGGALSRGARVLAARKLARGAVRCGAARCVACKAAMQLEVAPSAGGAAPRRRQEGPLPGRGAWN